MNGRRDLSFAAAAALLCGFIILAVPLKGLQLAAAVPLSLVLPGYAITAAAFGRRSPQWSQLLLLSVGMSLATLAIGGLALNYLPGGLGATSWTVLLVFVVVGGCVLASLGRPPAASNRLRRPRSPVTPVGRRRLVAAVLTGLGGALVVGLTLILSWTPVPAKDAIGYTQLWMLPSDSAKVRMQIGVVSQEQHPVTYRLRVRLGERSKPVSTLQSSGLVLKPGQQHVFQLRVKGQPPGTPVTALLFRREDPNTAYRRVTGWLPAT